MPKRLQDCIDRGTKNQLLVNTYIPFLLDRVLLQSPTETPVRCLVYTLKSPSLRDQVNFVHLQGKAVYHQPPRPLTTP
jgi:hypothetical protein